MKLLGLALLCGGVSGFAAVKGRAQDARTILREKMSSELGTPCEEECSMDSYPNMPASVHPGVLTGQAQVDLLNHAKENGELIPLVKGCE